MLKVIRRMSSVMAFFNKSDKGASFAKPKSTKSLLGKGVTPESWLKCQKKFSTKNVVKMASTRDLGFRNSSFKNKQSWKSISSRALPLVKAARVAHMPMLNELAFSRPIVFESESDLSSHTNKLNGVSERHLIDKSILEQDEDI